MAITGDEIKKQDAYNKKQDNALRAYFDMLFPQPLNKQEYINIVGIQKNGDKDQVTNKFVKSFDEFKDIVFKCRYHYDMYVSLATVRQINGTLKRIASSLGKRYVLFLDFDLKDYPEADGSAKYFTKIIQEKAGLFSHMIINSGNGYHFYFCVEQKNNISDIVALNEKLSALTVADPNACKSTQLARIPCSFNHKIDGINDYESIDDWHYVKVVNDSTKNTRFFPYNLHTLSGRIEQQLRTRKAEAKRATEYPKYIEAREPQCAYYCNQTIFQNGAKEGERNFWLGRLVSQYKKEGKSYERSKALVFDWNKRCYPPKNENELLSGFNGYWHGDYKLLGCVDSPTTGAYKFILEEVCDKARCKSCGQIVVNEGHGLRMATDLLGKKRMRNLDGYAYFILTLMYIHQMHHDDADCLTIGKILDRLVMKIGHGRDRKEYRCMSDDKCKQVLKKLADMKIITIKAPKNKSQIRFCKVRLVTQFKEFEHGYIAFYYSAYMALRMSVFSYNDYKMYLCLIYHLQTHKPCTYADLSEYLDITVHAVAKQIKHLEETEMIIIHKRKTEYGMTSYNHYSLYDKQVINGVEIYNGNDEVEEITLVA